ncbi:tigger transposable element-derived protein 1-like [Limulus polyphemus]|uniref:Tigger transposable element-derived protein 1-like n=1 Tax=Limulus polyphemus TaxID=6850 RepID=A0ABM1B2L4_LIMPO|nr:tigger transposable element-derived protein 1-like [Limulus polyphemus]
MLELKLEIVKCVEAGEGPSVLGCPYNLGKLTLCAIKKNADKINSSVIQSIPPSAKMMTKIRNPLLVKMEMLGLWIEDQNQKKMNLSFISIRGKALEIYECLIQEDGGAEQPFMASKGWFAKFIYHQSLHNLKVTGESASADHTAAARYPEEMREIIEAEGYSPKEVSNADETRLFWKEEKVASGFKAAKDRLILLLCGKAAGGFKMKSLLIYHSLNPHPFKGLNKKMLPVHWTANKKVWVTG